MCILLLEERQLVHSVLERLAVAQLVLLDLLQLPHERAGRSRRGGAGRGPSRWRPRVGFGNGTCGIVRVRVRVARLQAFDVRELVEPAVEIVDARVRVDKRGPAFELLLEALAVSRPNGWGLRLRVACNRWNGSGRRDSASRSRNRSLRAFSSSVQ